MSKAIADILRPLRRRYLLTQLAQAAAVGGVLGGMVAAPAMAAWILSGPFPRVAVILAIFPAVLLVLMLAWPPARRRLREISPSVYWPVMTAIVLSLASAAALAWGRQEHVSKNSLLAILPAIMLIGVLAALGRGAAMRRVAREVDRRANLAELMSTSLEIGPGESNFAAAVSSQAQAAAQDHHLRKMRFWSSGPRLPALLGLSVLAAVLMLPWPMLESSQQRQLRLWRQVAPAATADLQQRLLALQGKDPSDPAVRAELARLRQMLDNVEVVSLEQAGRWQDAVADLEDTARQLELAVASGKMDPALGGEASRLVRSLREAAEKIAAGMTQTGTEYLAGNRSDSEMNARPESQTPAGWTSVFQSGYEPYANVATQPEQTSPAAASGRTDFDQAWLEACRKASQAQQKTDLPADYRQLIRDFFSTAPAGRS